MSLTKLKGLGILKSKNELIKVKTVINALSHRFPFSVATFASFEICISRGLQN